VSDPISAKTPDGETHSDDTIAEISASESQDLFLRAVAAAPAAAPPCAEPDLIGTELGKYAIAEEIGRGGMGIIYAADDTKLRRRVALKVLPAKFAADPERRHRLLREARAASAVMHPNIATVYDVDEAAGRVYIAMELVDGRTLRRMLEAGPLPLNEALHCARSCAGFQSPEVGTSIATPRLTT
jgi:serine/threonine-protein kinase